jgi:short-subunit dehydrogenase
MIIMKHAVVTGSSTGIGFGLATEFLVNGFSVTVSSSSPDKLNKAYEQLCSRFPKENIHMQVCDMRSVPDIHTLWDSARERFGKVDIWVNNAGVGQDLKYIHELEEEIVGRIVDVNVKAVINASIIVFNKMREQGFGAIYNMEGFGSDGRKMDKLSVYGTSKAALTYFTESMIKENKHSKVIIGKISPGMVITDMLIKPAFTDQKDAERFLKVTNILGDKVETVTPWLVKKMISNTIHGKSFNWLTNLKASGRFITAPFKKRNLLSESDITILKP